jgi:hypothetical protein
MWAPQVEATEALKLELGYFNECILKQQRPINDGHAGLRIVKMLQAANQSLQNRGSQVQI